MCSQALYSGVPDMLCVRWYVLPRSDSAAISLCTHRQLKRDFRFADATRARFPQSQRQIQMAFLAPLTQGSLSNTVNFPKRVPGSKLAALGIAYLLPTVNTAHGVML